MHNKSSLRFDYRHPDDFYVGQGKRRRQRAGRFVLALATVAVGIGGAWLYFADSGLRSDEPGATVAAIDAHASRQLPAAEPPPEQIEIAPLPAQAGLGFDSISVIVRNNDTMDRIFRRLELSIADLARMREAPDLRQALDALRPGDEITFKHRDGTLEELVRRLNESQTLQVTRADDGFRANIIENPVEVEIARERVRIDSSLFEAANAAGVSDATALAVATIFGWDIDFVLDIRDGDEFTVVYEKVSQDGTYLRDGAVLVAEFINDGRVYRAIRYERPDGRADYYSPEGRSMHKAFLRAPVNFTRVSSRFNPRRRHPILNRIRAHNGVDYAAPSGTPIRAAGDGRVRFRGVKNGYGRAIELEHGGGITTLYAHMSRFAKSSNFGARVQQGDVIGYVGMTGLATAAHLHYEYRLHGTHRNPQTVQLPEAKPIAPEWRADFAAHAAPMVAELELTKHAPQFAGR